MNATPSKKNSPPREMAVAPWCVTLAKWMLAVGLLASLLFAHGCHGDGDHELLGQVVGMLLVP